MKLIGGSVFEPAICIGAQCMSPSGESVLESAILYPCVVYVPVRHAPSRNIVPPERPH